jgi:hypothetical protein
MDKIVLSNQLKTLLDIFEQLQSESKYNDLSDLPKSDRQSLVSRSIAAINRITGSNSSYSLDVDKISLAEPLPKAFKSARKDKI